MAVRSPNRTIVRSRDTRFDIMAIQITETAAKRIRMLMDKQGLTEGASG
jgi:uncharacterized protein (UPF0371 family)